MGWLSFSPASNQSRVAQALGSPLEGTRMGRSALTLLASLSCICVLGAGCGSMQSPGSEASSGVPSNSIPSASPTKVKPAADSDFDPKNFNHPLEITNQYFRLVLTTAMAWLGQLPVASRRTPGGLTRVLSADSWLARLGVSPARCPFAA